MGIKVDFTSRSALFLNKFNRNKGRALEQMGEHVTPIIIKEAPKKTGDLKKSVGFESTNKTLIMYADIYYATFVELGTYKMSANPFMKRAIVKSNSAFTRIIVRSLSV